MIAAKYPYASPKTITNILTLRYNPIKSSLITKLSWKDFVESPQKKSIEYIEESIKNNLSKTIKKSKNTKVTIALSGGVDSSLTLAILRKTFPDISIHAISMKFADSVDESKIAKKIAEKFDAEYELVYIDNYLKELPKAISVVKLPFWDLHWYHVAKKAKLASDFLISGDGGDELFGGYTFRYKKFLSLIKLNSTPEEKVKAYLQCHERDWVPDQDKVFDKKSRFSWHPIYNLLKPYFCNKLPLLSQVFLADFNGKLLYNWIPLYTKIHKHFGIKYISPILSQELISYATHLPNKLKYNTQKNLGKPLLRKLLSQYLDSKLLTNTKQGFSVNTVNLWKSHGQKLCQYYLSEARIVKDGWINGQWIKSKMKRLENDPDVRYVNKFLGLLAFEVWYRLFITKEIKPSTKL